MPCLWHCYPSPWDLGVAYIWRSTYFWTSHPGFPTIFTRQTALPGHDLCHPNTDTQHVPNLRHDDIILGIFTSGILALMTFYKACSEVASESYAWSSRSSIWASDSLIIIFYLWDVTALVLGKGNKSGLMKGWGESKVSCGLSSFSLLCFKYNVELHYVWGHKYTAK